MVSLQRHPCTNLILEGCGGIVAEQLASYNFEKASLHNHKIAEEGATKTPQETQISQRPL